MNLTVETEREQDGRWIAEVPDLSGVLAYGETRDQAIARAEALALRVLADRRVCDGDYIFCKRAERMLHV